MARKCNETEDEAGGKQTNKKTNNKRPKEKRNNDDDGGGDEEEEEEEKDEEEITYADAKLFKTIQNYSNQARAAGRTTDGSRPSKLGRLFLGFFFFFLFSFFCLLS